MTAFAIDLPAELMFNASLGTAEIYSSIGRPESLPWKYAHLSTNPLDVFPHCRAQLTLRGTLFITDTRTGVPLFVIPATSIKALEPLFLWHKQAPVPHVAVIDVSHTAAIEMLKGIENDANAERDGRHRRGSSASDDDDDEEFTSAEKLPCGALKRRVIAHWTVPFFAYTVPDAPVGAGKDHAPSPTASQEWPYDASPLVMLRFDSENDSLDFSAAVSASAITALTNANSGIAPSVMARTELQSRLSTFTRAGHVTIFMGMGALEAAAVTLAAQQHNDPGAKSLQHNQGSLPPIGDLVAKAAAEAAAKAAAEEEVPPPDFRDNPLYFTALILCPRAAKDLEEGRSLSPSTTQRLEIAANRAKLLQGGKGQPMINPMYMHLDDLRTNDGRTAEKFPFLASMGVKAASTTTPEDVSEFFQLGQEARLREQQSDRELAKQALETVRRTTYRQRAMANEAFAYCRELEQRAKWRPPPPRQRAGVYVTPADAAAALQQQHSGSEPRGRSVGSSSGAESTPSASLSTVLATRARGSNVFPDSAVEFIYADTVLSPQRTPSSSLPGGWARPPLPK